jgi:lipoprotein-anchoring transpeptidase ErfK/SrfK
MHSDFSNLLRRNAILYGACALLFFAPSMIAQEPVANDPFTHKRVEIDKTEQVLRAYEGDQLVFQSHVSTGKQGKRTPNGNFQALTKQRMHRSRLYHNAPMPFSVQISGNYFIHGFSSVPNHPASHGCIRLPIEDSKRLFDWIAPGTPISITGKWRH